MNKQLNKTYHKSLITILLLLSFSYAKAQDPIDAIATKYHQWIVGSASIDYSNPYITTRYDKLMDKVKKAETATIPNDLSSKDARTDLWDDVLFPLAISYNLAGPASQPNTGYQSTTTKNKIIAIFNALNADGWNANFSMDWGNLSTYPDTGIIGLGGSYGNITASYAVSVFLCKDILSAAGIYQREMATLNNATAATGPAFEEPVLWEVGGLNADFIAGLMLNRLAYVLALESGTTRNTELLYFQRMLNKALTIADGFADFIKSDYTTNHHKGPYVSTYGSEGLGGAAVMTYILNNTAYAASTTSISNLSNALLASRIFSNLYDYHQGASGRSGSYDRFVNLVPAFAHVASINSEFSNELKGAFKRYWAPSHPRFSGMIDDFKPGKGYVDSMGAIELMTNLANDTSFNAETAPNGHWYFNYAGMSVHRKKEWAAIWKGQGKYLWDYEGPKSKKDNIYGKYGSAGALIILNGSTPVSRAESGMPEEGWDWRRVPGTTTLNTTYDAIPTDNDRDFPNNIFIGGLNINDDFGISSLTYRDRLSSLQANKSVFYFKDYIVALGSGISAANDNEEVQTTLFQTALKDIDSPTYLNNTTLTGIGITETKNNQSVTATDATGNAYYIPNAKNFVLERIQQTAPDQTGKKTFSENYVSARLLHGSKPNNDSYEYYIKVDGEKEGANELQSNTTNLFDILKHDNDAHIVSYKPENTTAYALMAKNKTTGQFIKQTNVPCIAMTKSTNSDTIDIAVMNPEVGKLDSAITYNDIKSRKEWHAKPSIQPVILTIVGNWEILSGENAEIISNSGTETQIQFDCIDGKKIQASLEKSNLSIPPIDQPNNTQITISPNPFTANSKIRTTSDNPILSVEVYDTLGRRISNNNYGNGQTEINLPFFQTNNNRGLFLILIKTAKFNTTVKGFK